MTRDGGKGENDLHCNPLRLRSPGSPLLGLNRESMESNFDASQVTRFKTWGEAPLKISQLSMATNPLCFEFFRCLVDVLQS